MSLLDPPSLSLHCLISPCLSRSLSPCTSACVSICPLLYLYFLFPSPLSSFSLPYPSHALFHRYIPPPLSSFSLPYPSPSLFHRYIPPPLSSFSLPYPSPSLFHRYIPSPLSYFSLPYPSPALFHRHIPPYPASLSASRFLSLYLCNVITKKTTSNCEQLTTGITRLKHSIPIQQALLHKPNHLHYTTCHL